MKPRVIVLTAALLACTALSAQKYEGGLIDKTVAVVGNEVILISDIESEVQQERAQGRSSDRDMRCTILENMMENKIFLMQARIDSLTVNNDMVEGELTNRIDNARTIWVATKSWKSTSASRCTASARNGARCSRT